MTDPADDRRGLGSPGRTRRSAGRARRPRLSHRSVRPVRPPPGAAAPAKPPARTAGAAPRLAAVIAAAVLAGGVSGAGMVVALDRDGPTAGPTIVQQRSAPRGRGAPRPGSTEAAAEQILPSVVQVRAGRGSGSGVVMDGRARADQPPRRRRREQRLPGARHRPSVSAEVVGCDRDNDIAVLRARGGDLPAATLGVSADLRIGQPVIAVGSPLGPQRHGHLGRGERTGAALDRRGDDPDRRLDQPRQLRRSAGRPGRPRGRASTPRSPPSAAAAPATSASASPYRSTGPPRSPSRSWPAADSGPAAGSAAGGVDHPAVHAFRSARTWSGSSASGMFAASWTPRWPPADRDRGRRTCGRDQWVLGRARRRARTSCGPPRRS